MSRFSAETKKENKHLLITLMLGVVVFGGAVSFLFRNSEEEETKKKTTESIVDITLPTPPPPPPPETDPDLTEPEETDIKEESSEPEIAPSTEMASESSDLDLGLDIGDLAEGTGGGFVVNVPRFATRGGKGGGGDGLGSDEADSPPTPISKLPPTYPSTLLSKGVGGRVMISCVVDASGQVVSSSIKQSSGHSELDKAALAAVARWKFKPAVKEGRSIKSTCSVPFNFEVKKS
jgi:periplasmic protein TonB